MSQIFSKLLKSLDRAVEVGARASARIHGRRSFLAKSGALFVSGAAAQILPFDRAFAAGTTGEDECGYWRNCALDGMLCQQSGGTSTSCPPGSQASSVSWVGTCHNPEDSKDYLVSYNDCCGKKVVNPANWCISSKGERPGYRMGLFNEINWCMANTNKGYHCTVAVVVGLAD